MTGQTRRRLVVGSVAALAAGFVMGAAASGVVDKVIPVNPEAGLTDAKRLERHDQLRRQFATRYAEWLLEFAAGGRSAEALPRADLMVSFDRPPLDAAQAASGADVIARGHVEGVTYLPDGTTEITLRAASGSGRGVPSDGLVRFTYLGGPQPADDEWHDAILAVSEANRPLFPVNEVVVLLAADGPSQELWLQPFTGLYTVGRDGRIAAEPGNPFRASVEGRPADDVLAEMGSVRRR